MDYSKRTDVELTGIRARLPKYRNEMTSEQGATSNAVFLEQDRRYKAKKAEDTLEYNRQVEAAGYKAGDKVSCFAASWTGCGGDLLTGKIGFRKKYFVKLDTPFNGKKSTHLTKAWRVER